MRESKKILSGLLLAALVLGGCVPGAVQSGEPPYPIEDTEAPDQAEVQDLSGSLAYNANPQVPQEELMALASGNNAFALDLYQQLSVEVGNVFYSPYSIFQALVMAYAGAGGETATQMADSLHLADISAQVHETMNALNLSLQDDETAGEEQAGFEFNVANALWGQQGYIFTPSFLDLLSANYGAGLKTVDFADTESARDLINLWVAAQTNDKIRDLIPEGVLNAMTRLVLTNAVYFKAAWLSQFDPARTVDGDFTRQDGSTVQVPMMEQTLNTAMMVSETLEMLSLPYEDEAYEMLIMMPRLGDLEEFEQMLTEARLNELIGGMSSNEVKLSMPRFKLESSFALGDQMQALGMQDAFDAELADFSGMDGSKDLFISALVHKAFVEVNEEGTEAAAATGVVVGIKSMPAEPYVIRLDHPFLFLIREAQTGTILFIGRVAAP